MLRVVLLAVNSEDNKVLQYFTTRLMVSPICIMQQEDRSQRLSVGGEKGLAGKSGTIGLQADELDENALMDRDDEVLQRAAEIRRMKAAAGRTGWQEPKRSKGHREHLHEEMQWMAKEFSK